MLLILLQISNLIDNKDLNYEDKWRVKIVWEKKNHIVDGYFGLRDLHRWT